MWVTWTNNAPVGATKNNYNSVTNSACVAVTNPYSTAASAMNNCYMTMQIQLNLYTMPLSTVSAGALGTYTGNPILAFYLSFANPTTTVVKLPMD